MQKRRKTFTPTERASMGGKAILAKRGAEYFSKLGKRSAKARRIAKQNHENHE